MEIVLLFTEHDFTVPIHFRNKGCSVFVYSDKREDVSYIPSVRPWLLSKYFAESPAAVNDIFFYIDSDIIFREWIDFATLDFSTPKVYGANCSGYIDTKYIKKCTEGEAICTKMAEICGTSLEAMDKVPGIGAQLVFTKLSADFWKRCYIDSNKIYHYLESTGSNIQIWTAEMWAQQWGWLREGLAVEVYDQLNFCTPTDLIEKWDEFKILHNAGVTPDRSHELFYKGQYFDTSPIGKNFDWVSSKYASRKYADAVEKVLQ